MASAASSEDAGDRLRPSWRSVLRSLLVVAGRQPDEVVESTGWVLLSMDEDGDRTTLPLHSAICCRLVHTSSSYTAVVAAG